MRIGATLVLLLCAAPLWAQDRVAVGGGYSALTARDFTGGANGWFAVVSYDTTAPVAIAAEVDTFAQDEASSSLSLSARLTTIAGGLEFHGPRTRRVVAFGQALFGAAISRAMVTGPISSSRESASISIAQVGGGADIVLTPAFALRAGLSAIVPQPYHANNWRYSVWRIAAGGVYRFGAR